MGFGFHVSIGSKILLAMERAIGRKSATMQFFVSSPRSRRSSSFDKKDMNEFRRGAAKAELNRWRSMHLTSLIQHYLPLIFYLKSIAAVQDSVEKAEIGDADLVLFHMGNHKEQGLRRTCRYTMSL
jgi:endonuclease IV